MVRHSSSTECGMISPPPSEMVPANGLNGPVLEPRGPLPNRVDRSPSYLGSVFMIHH